MRLALRHAQHAFREKEVPIGAVIVDGNGTVLATSRNQVEGKKDVTAHAEIDCLRKASQLRNNWRLHDCVLYSTLEPCPMCLGAIQASRIKRVVYAASDVRVGACGSWVDLVGAKHPYHELEVRGGLLHEESSILLKRFFQMRRREAKDSNADGNDENRFKEFIDRGYGIDAMLDSNDDK
jgi:tRNA(adenine34) deaminase